MKFRFGSFSGFILSEAFGSGRAIPRSYRHENPDESFFKGWFTESLRQAASFAIGKRRISAFRKPYPP
jgi:hypothetical protein